MPVGTYACASMHCACVYSVYRQCMEIKSLLQVNENSQMKACTDLEFPLLFPNVH